MVGDEWLAMMRGLAVHWIRFQWRRRTAPDDHHADPRRIRTSIKRDVARLREYGRGPYFAVESCGGFCFTPPIFPPGTPRFTTPLGGAS